MTGRQTFEYINHCFYVTLEYENCHVVFCFMYAIAVVFYIRDVYVIFTVVYQLYFCHCSIYYNCILYYKFLYAIYLQHILFCNSLMSYCMYCCDSSMHFSVACHVFMLYYIIFFIYVLSFTLFYCYLVYHQRAIF